MQYGLQGPATCEDLKIVWCTDTRFEVLHKPRNFID